MKKVALIYSNYFNPVKMYYIKWPEQFKSTQLDFRSYSLISPDHKNDVNDTTFYTEGLPIKFKRVLKFSLRGNATIKSWLKEQSQLSLREKFNLFSEFGDLITYKPDIIHMVNSSVYIKIRNLKYPNHPKFISSFRGYDIVTRPYTDPFWASCERELFQKADCLHFVSDWLKSKAIEIGAPSEKSIVVYAGVDSDFFSPKFDKKKTDFHKKFKIVSTGRLVKLKGYEYAIHAIKKMIDDGIDANYSIVGSGDDIDELTRLAIELQIEHKVHFLGTKSKSQLKDILENADIYIHPSLTDALPGAVLEACAMGLPVVASNVGGIPEIIQDNVNGLLVEPGDSDALAKAIKNLVYNPAHAIELGQAARKTILSKFSIEQETKNWQELYLQL